MGLLQDVGKLYSLETLDTRFVIPNNAPLSSSVAEIESEDWKPTPTKDARPSLWRTPEFFGYYFVFLTVVPIMVWIPMQISMRMYGNAHNPTQ